MFGFVKDLLGFNIGGVVADGKLNPTNIGLPRTAPVFKYNRPQDFNFAMKRFGTSGTSKGPANSQFQFKIGGIVRRRSTKLKKRKRGCGCKK